jgi:hypothetical protein
MIHIKWMIMGEFYYFIRSFMTGSSGSEEEGSAVGGYAGCKLKK